MSSIRTGQETKSEILDVLNAPRMLSLQAALSFLGSLFAFNFSGNLLLGAKNLRQARTPHCFHHGQLWTIIFLCLYFSASHASPPVKTLSLNHDTIGAHFVKAELRGFVTCPNGRLYVVPENGAIIRCEDFTPYYESLEEHDLRRLDLELNGEGKK